MLINEVESKVGLSKKSIRYYEANNLLTINRDTKNDYRDFSEQDILILRKIKFLRELGVPIKDLKMLKENKLSLNDCIIERMKQIKNEQENYQKTLDMCSEILKNNDTYENIDITKYFMEISKLNKEGFTMRNLKSQKSKKIIGAVFSSLIFASVLIAVLVLIIYLKIKEDNMPWIIFIIFLSIISIPLGAIVYNLVLRIKEILGGEEDEASKY